MGQLIARIALAIGLVSMPLAEASATVRYEFEQSLNRITDFDAFLTVPTFITTTQSLSISDLVVLNNSASATSLRVDPNGSGLAQGCTDSTCDQFGLFFPGGGLNNFVFPTGTFSTSGVFFDAQGSFEGSVVVTEFADAVPEPSTWVLILAGFAGLGFVGYRRRRAVAA
jgi:PEP-CTERM motif